MDRFPEFPTEQRARLCVQRFDPSKDEVFEDPWEKPRPATTKDVFEALRELTREQKDEVIRVVGRSHPPLAEVLESVRLLWAEHRAQIAGAIGILPDDVAERLRMAEGVIDAIGDAALSIDRFRQYRKKYPDKMQEPDEPQSTPAAAEGAL